MQDIPSFGKIMVFAGLGLAALGGLFLLAGKLPFLGRLPGDIRVEREGFSLYFPLATCILFSLLLSGILWVASRLK